ncbi:MAG TPA: translation initiation factor eIF-2B [Roseiflexaceae bacterium]|nr:translation initiation factor eIF-2B [Roseiflexaceae bacterium]
MDNRSGAAAIAERAADVLLRRASSGAAASPDAFRQELLATGWTLIRAQPLMAPLVNLVNAVLWKLEEHDNPAELRLAVAQATDEFKRQLRQNALRVAEGALGLIPDGSTVMTIAHSGTVEQALLHARRAGRRFSVICLESRPACEGREAATALASADIPVKLAVDVAAAQLAKEAQLVLVGADLLNNHGVVNKIGTRMLALVARSASLPFYTLCGGEKFLPPGYCTPKQPQSPAEEVWEAPARGVTISNYYFEWTPLEELSGIVTEQGTLPVAAVEGWLAAIKLHPALASGELEAVAHH